MDKCELNKNDDVDIKSILNCIILLVKFNREINDLNNPKKSIFNFERVFGIQIVVER